MPAPYPHLKHAPIVEAVLDIRVSFRKGLEIETLKGGFEILKEDYPEIKEERMIEVRHHFSAKDPDNLSDPLRKQTFRGFRFISNEKNQLVQFRRDGFTYNRLSPYPSWEDVRNESKRLWDVYCQVAKGFDVSRLALRYINKIEFNPLEEELTDIFTSEVCIPQKLDLEVGSFLNQTLVKQPKSDIFANYTFSRDRKNVNQQPVEILLDIDVYRNGPYDNLPEALFETFEELRNFKNDLFFSSIKTSALTRFQND
ncbi:MAG: TIGR04255 family protein [Verrucomicrobia bacterium]|nr:TIGR04255 family protein [Verrucomicrobiota bacterium]